MALQKIKEAAKSVLGTFTGKCCDSNVFNNNDMHLSDKLFGNLLDSEEYKRAMENHHYIGYLGHPADPDCQDYEHACIVMKDMRLLDNGEIEGDFDLVDTPVGRIVKSFIDAGVKFGISIRGLGDVDGNGEVDPEGFIFRGFDLVTFPAYDDCIPEFKAIAASTDTKKKKAFKKVCASINANLKDISSSETLEFIQDQFNEGSDEFNIIQERIDELACPAEEIEENCISDDCNVVKDQLNAVTDLYIDAMARIRELESQLAECQVQNNEILIECKTTKAKYSHMRRIVASQLETARTTCLEASEDIKKKEGQLSRIKASLDTTRNRLREKELELDQTKQSYERIVTANTNLRDKMGVLLDENKANKQAIESANNTNLKYKRKIEANSDIINQKDSDIQDIKQKLHETVVANKRLESEVLNRDAKDRELLSRITAAEEMVLSYQQAYANIYANALGVYLKDLPVTASTSVDELKRMISAGTSTAGVPAAPAYIDADSDEEFLDDEVIENSDDEVRYDAGLTTL